MKFEQLTEGLLLRRYKRFLTDVQKKDGQIEQMYIGNTGPMKGVSSTNVKCLYSKIKNPKKMEHKIEFILEGDSTVGVNTHNPNKLMEDSLDKLPIEVNSYKREFKIANSKFDFIINDNILLEVKNVTCAINNKGFFPDTISERALKHAKDLVSLKKEGYVPYLVYIIQRDDVDEFVLGDEYYPEYCEYIREQYNKGNINILAYDTKLNLKDLSYNLHNQIDINF